MGNMVLTLVLSILRFVYAVKQISRSNNLVSNQQIYEKSTTKAMFLLHIRGKKRLGKFVCTVK